VACRPEIDLSRRITSPDLLGEVLRVRDELRTGSLQSLRTALGDLYGNARIRRALDRIPGDDEVQQILDEAVMLCLDGLEPGE